MRCANSNQQMNVVGYAANGFGNSIKRANRAANVSMKARTPICRDERALVFGAENNVTMKTEMS
jgi:hypothetical protein